MGTNWQRLVENMERGGETRFSMDWYLNHPITRQLLQADIQWGKTLELASGIGIRALLLRQQKNCPVVGIDIDDFAVEYSNKMAQDQFGFTRDEVYFSKGSFYEIPVPDDSFDNVILLAGLEHAFYPVKVLDEIQRVIREGGKLFLSITENNYHADPDHKSSWNESSVTRLLSSYGTVVTWVTEHIIFAILEFRNRVDEPRVTVCDLNIKDAYTPYWIDAFDVKTRCEAINLGVNDMQFASPELVNSILESSSDTNVLFFGTGAAFKNMDDVCLKVRQINPNVIISKWFGDATDLSAQVDRYIVEVYEPSHYFDQAFMVDTKRIGQISKSCGQFFMNGLYDPKAIDRSIPWQDRPIDVLCIANAYSQERLRNIRAFLPKEKYRFLWVGDGSSHGRVPRQLSNNLYGQAKIVLNIIDARHRKTQHWISNRVYWAMASGALVFSSPTDGLEELFDGNLVVLGDDPEEWHRAYENWLDPERINMVEHIIGTNQEHLSKFHTFDYKVYSILRHAGFATSLPMDNGVSIIGENNQLKKETIDFDLRDNEFIFRQTISSLSYNRKLELGCGATKSAGFLGADRFAMPGVDVIMDLNHTFPFADNSVDLVYASHSLEHVEDLPFTMDEIYRVCKHGSQVCIVAPYYHQSLNIANPYHKQVFNEHTPRFWTNYHNVPIEKAEYDHPASYLWGLAESDNSIAPIDMRILRMEYFYYPEYRALSVEEQRSARKKSLDVCDQIMYNLVVIKEEVEDFEMTRMVQETNLYEPPYVTTRKMNERFHQTEQVDPDIINFRDHAINIANELSGMRESRITRLVNRFRRFDLFHLLNPAFQRFVDQRNTFQNVDGFLLQPSVDLRNTDFLAYRVKLNRPNLCGVWVAPLLDIPLQHGMLGIELVSPKNIIVIQKTVPVSKSRKDLPLQFVFDPITDTQQGVWELRVFAREMEGPIRLLEWRRYSWGGLGRLRTRTFAALDFS